MKAIINAVHNTANLVLVGAVGVALVASAVALWNGPARQLVHGSVQPGEAVRLATWTLAAPRRGI